MIIVNDGSNADDTYETAERMADVYTGYVRVVHHSQNMGYGAALQTGLRTALRTEHGLIAFCDADNQFDVESFGTLVSAFRMKTQIWRLAIASCEVTRSDVELWAVSGIGSRAAY